MENLAALADYLGPVLYGALALVAWRIHVQQRSEPSRWVLATFTLLLALSLVGLVLPDDLGSSTPGLLLLKAILVAIAVFPYLLHRFSASLAAPPRWWARAADAGLVAVAVATVLLPRVPEVGGAPAWFTAYAFGFVGYWFVLFGSIAWRFFAASRGEPTLARRRLRLLAGGALLMGLTLVVSFALGQAADGGGAAGDVASAVFSLGSGVLFLLGFDPPGVLRVAWREPEEAALQSAAAQLLAATSRAEATRVLLPRLADLVGARSVVLRDPQAREVDTHGAPIGPVVPGQPDLLRVALGDGELLARTSPYAPFLGDEEERLFRRLGVMADLALERSALLDQLRAANDALADANEELEAFVYSASHDLKNPLIALLGYLDILRREYAERLDDDGRWYLQRMITNGTFMESLIHDLLELSRVGRMEVEPSEIDTPALLEDLCEDLRTRYPEAEVTVGPLPRLVMNPTRARQLFANLLENAAKYGGRSDVAIRVDAERGELAGRIVVSDDGVGIPDEFRERVFGVFERLDVDDSKSQGTGIGLAICRKIVEGIGGRIHAAPSTIGARIEIDLPTGAVVGPPPATATPRPEEATP